MQHGLAQNKDENPERPLSDAGTKETSSIAHHLSKISFSPSTIYHSGKTRTLQTAEILAKSTGIASSKVKPHSQLSPNDDIAQLIPQLQHNALYIGHLPHLEKLCAFLLTGKENAGVVQFRNSGVLCLSLDKNEYLINWYLTPEIANISS